VSEYDLHVSIVEYLNYKYPESLFQSDLSGVRLPIGLATKMKRIQKDRAWPDLFIAEARGQYHGLFIEIKTDRDEVYKKNGKLRAITHIREQYDKLRQLERRGYKAIFGCGFEHIRQVIDEYLGVDE